MLRTFCSEQGDKIAHHGQETTAQVNLFISISMVSTSTACDQWCAGPQGAWSKTGTKAAASEEKALLKALESLPGNGTLI